MIGGVLSALSNTNATYQRKESMLAPDIPVYVLGEVQQGGLIGKPASGSKNKTFVISHKSEEERTKSLTSTTRWLLVIAIVLLVLAAGLAGAGASRWARNGRAAADYAARLSAPPSRSSAASSVASRLAKQKRTTERIGSFA